MTAATREMVQGWIELHKGDVEGLARWMRDSLRVGSLPECRAMIHEAMSPDQIRAEIARLLASPNRTPSIRKQIASLEWDLDHMTATEAVNARRADMGLEPWEG